MNHQISLLLQIVAIYIIPVALIQYNLVSYKNRIYLFTSAILAILASVWYQQISLFTLGIFPQELFKFFQIYLWVSIFSLCLIYLIKRFFRLTQISNIWSYAHFRYGFVILSIAQEFAYRSVLMYQLKAIFISPYIIIILNALIFIYIHIIYKSFVKNISLTFIAGIMFAYLFYYYPNLILISALHSLLNFYAIKYKLIGNISKKDLNSIKLN